MDYEVKRGGKLIKSNADRGEFAIRGAAFLNIDRGREMILPGAYSANVEKFVKRGKVLIDHVNQTDKLAGSITTAYETDRGLIIKGNFSSTAQGQKARQMALEGTLKSVSIGHYPREVRDIKADEVKEIWAKYNYQPTAEDLDAIKRGPVRLLVKCDPVEVSFVGVPMNEDAEILEVKSAPDVKRGAVLNRGNSTALKQVYKLVKQMLRGARQELDDEMQSKPVQPAENATPTTEGESKGLGLQETKSGASKLRMELDLLTLEIAR